MNILCYGGSAERQKERCEFFHGAGCCAEWATDTSTALRLLATKSFDSVVFDRSIPAGECAELSGLMRSISPKLVFFSLAAMENNLSDDSIRRDSDQPQWSSLVSVYLNLSSRGSNLHP